MHNDRLITIFAIIRLSFFSFSLCSMTVTSSGWLVVGIDTFGYSCILSLVALLHS